MSSAYSFTIEARIDDLSDGVGCFDPMRVIYSMRAAFPELIEHSRDYLLEICDRFRRFDGNEEAFRLAVRDMQERGPKIQFEIPLSDGRLIRGTAERYWLLVNTNEEFPAEFRLRFTKFLASMKLQTIQIRDGEDI